MYRKFLFIILVVFSILRVWGEDFYYSAGDLEALLSDPPEVILKNETFRGYSLLERLPLMEEVYSLDIRTAAGPVRIDDPELAEEWGESFLVRHEGRPALMFRDVLYPRVEELRFSGGRLEAGSLEIWLGWEGVDELKAEIAAFARHHRLEIKTLEVPSPDTKLLAVVRSRGTPPDLVMIQSGALGRLVESRGLQNLDYMDFKGLLPRGREAFTLENKFWAMPFYFDTQVLYYNRNLVPELSPDNWNLAAMEREAEKLKARNINPLVWNAYSSNWLIPFQMSFGKNTLIDPDGGITVDDQPSLKALEYILSLKNRELLVPMERDAMDALFIAGKVGMILSGSYAIPYFESLKLNFGVLPYPFNQTTGRPVSSLLDFKAFCMSRRTRNPILARRMLQHLYGPGVQQRFSTGQNKLPAREDLQESFARNSVHGQILRRSAVSGTVIPPDSVYGVYKNHMWKLIRFALSGQMPPAETLRQGQRLMDANQ